MHLLNGPLSSFKANDNCNGSWPFPLHTPDGALFQPQTEDIQSSREACPWYGAHLNSTL